jgi:hypothetical protein
MSESRQTILEADGISGRVCVDFEQHDGHYSHAIWLVVGHERMLVFNSAEDPARANLPCFTELHQQGKNLFLTGANGLCHWSMSVEVGDAYFRGSAVVPSGETFVFDERYGLNAPNQDTGDPAFHFLYFDVACRLKEDVESLGTVYARTGSALSLGRFTAESGQLWQDLGHEKAELTFGANPDPKSVRFDPNPRCMVAREQGDDIWISASQSEERRYPATVQWSYGFWV